MFIACMCVRVHNYGSVPPTLARCFQYFFAIISVFFIFLTGVTFNSRRWEVVKISMSPKRPFFLACWSTFKLHSSGIDLCSFMCKLVQFINLF